MHIPDLAKKYGTTPDARMLVTRLCELAQRAHDRGIPQYSAFLSPAERGICAQIAELRAVVAVAFDGGYPDAERTVAVLVPHACGQTPQPPVTAIAIEYKGERLSHRDLLGALMALGIKREKIGDLIADATPPLLLCDTVIAPYIIDHLERAGHNRVRASIASVSEIPAPVTARITCTVQSLRLDAIVAEGFRMSRTNAADAIKRGLVFLNWIECTSPSKEVFNDDNITLRGMGKLKIAEIGGNSRKGRTFVALDIFQ